MPVNKIPTEALEADSVTADILAPGSVSGADIGVGEITVDKLHSTLDFSGKTVSGMDLSTLDDVASTAPSTGQVLKWNGTAWEPGTDLTATGGTGITLTDLSVNVATAGTADLSYDNTSGLFTYTPPDLTSFSSLTSLSMATGVAITEFSTDNTLGDAANDAVPTEAAVKSYIDSAVSGISFPSETNDLSSVVTWADVPDANITQGSVTQHQAALSITESQISDLQSYVLPSSAPDLIGINEIMAAGTVSGGALALNMNSARIITTSSVTADFQIALTNAPTTGNLVLGFAVILEQGTTPVTISGITVNGGGTVYSNGSGLKWADSYEPSGYANQTDVFSFTLILNSGTYSFLGQLSTFG
jgi:hypothetical protein